MHPKTETKTQNLTIPRLKQSKKVNKAKNSEKSLQDLENRDVVKFGYRANVKLTYSISVQIPQA